MTLRAASSAALASTTYTYDNEARLAAVSNAAFTVQYEYSSDSRDAGHIITASGMGALTSNDFKMSKKCNPTNLFNSSELAFNALATPLFIGLNKHRWDGFNIGEKRVLLGHEGRHYLHSTKDHYANRIPGIVVEDAYNYGGIFE